MEYKLERYEMPVAAAEEREVREPVYKPMCPRCGWRNTRLSYQRTAIDTVLAIFAFRAFRCRSCGNRFRTIHRDQSAVA